MAIFVYSGATPAWISTKDGKSFFVNELVEIIDQTRSSIKFEILTLVENRTVAHQLVLTKFDENFTLDHDGKIVVSQRSVREVIDWLDHNY